MLALKWKDCVLNALGSEVVHCFYKHLHIHQCWGLGSGAVLGQEPHSRGCSVHSSQAQPDGLLQSSAAGCHPGNKEAINQNHLIIKQNRQKNTEEEKHEIIKNNICCFFRPELDY